MTLREPSSFSTRRDLLLRRISSVGCRRGDEMLLLISLCTSEMDVTIICLLWGFTIKVKRLHRTELVGVSLRLFPTRLAILLGLRMIYLFEFLTFWQFECRQSCCCCKNENSDTIISVLILQYRVLVTKKFMEDLYVKSTMAHAMDKIIFELQNYFKGSRSKISFDLTMGRTLSSIKRQEMFSNVRSCTCFFLKKNHLVTEISAAYWFLDKIWSDYNLPKNTSWAFNLQGSLLGLRTQEH